MRLAGIDTHHQWDSALDHLLNSLQHHRNEKGEWRRFPFYFTLLSLMDLRHPLAQQEITYALPQCVKRIARLKPKDEITNRRHTLLTRILDQYG